MRHMSLDVFSKPGLLWVRLILKTGPARMLLSVPTLTAWSPTSKAHPDILVMSTSVLLSVSLSLQQSHLPVIILPGNIADEVQSAPEDGGNRDATNSLLYFGAVKGIRNVEEVVINRSVGCPRRIPPHRQDVLLEFRMERLYRTRWSYAAVKDAHGCEG